MVPNVERLCGRFVEAVRGGEPDAESALLAWMVMQVSPEMRGRGLSNVADLIETRAPCVRLVQADHHARLFPRLISDGGGNARSASAAVPGGS